MKKRKKNLILLIITCVLIIALIAMFVESVIGEKNKSKKKAIMTDNGELEPLEAIADTSEIEEKDEMKEVAMIADTSEDDNKENIAGKDETEENEPESTTENEEQKVIEAVKKEWGENDDSVTYTIEKKNGNKYRVAVRNSSTVVLQWYEVNTENWEVNEY